MENVTADELVKRAAAVGNVMYKLHTLYIGCTKVTLSELTCIEKQCIICSSQNYIFRAEFVWCGIFLSC